MQESIDNSIKRKHAVLLFNDNRVHKVFCTSCWVEAQICQEGRAEFSGRTCPPIDVRCWSSAIHHGFDNTTCVPIATIAGCNAKQNGCNGVCDICSIPVHFF